MHLDIMPFFGEAISNHFRQFSGGYLWFLHDSVPLFKNTVGLVRGFGGRLFPHLAFRLGDQSLCPATRRPLWRAGKAAAGVLLRQKSVFNLRVDFVQPLFGAVGFISIKLNFSL